MPADCLPVGLGVYNKDGSTRSCHNSGRAIDVMGVKCGSRPVSKPYGKVYDTMVKCMRKKFYKTIFKDGGLHEDHAHFSLGCYGGSYY